MTNRTSLSSQVLPVAHAVLRILIVLNWIYGAAILLLFIVSMANEQWFAAALKFPATPDSERLLLGFRGIMLLGLAAVPLNRTVLKQLRAIVGTVRAGDPFIASNAGRLRTIGWMLVALNLLSIVIGAIAMTISTSAYPLHLDAGFSISGWLAVLLTFVLAGVFAEGAEMREDLEGTV